MTANVSTHPAIKKMPVVRLQCGYKAVWKDDRAQRQQAEEKTGIRHGNAIVIKVGA